MADRPRNEALAAFLSLLVPGLGQIYNGEARKGALLVGAWVLAGALAVGLVLSPWFHLGLPVGIVLGVGLWGFAIVDAILGARRRSESYELKPYNRVLIYLGILATVALLRGGTVAVLRGHFVQAFRMPSESMMPTLLAGDFVFVDRRSSARTPARGEVIVFEDPTELEKQFIKRVVAVGGDLFEMRDKVAYVNGQPTDERFVVHIDPAIHPAGFDPRDNCGPYRVPKFSYFVLGDNRDNSNDSRFFGPVPQASVRGRVRGIYWSWGIERKGPRWERVGMLVR